MKQNAFFHLRFLIPIDPSALVTVGKIILKFEIGIVVVGPTRL